MTCSPFEAVGMPFKQPPLQIIHFISYLLLPEWFSWGIKDSLTVAKRVLRNAARLGKLDHAPVYGTSATIVVKPKSGRKAKVFLVFWEEELYADESN